MSAISAKFPTGVAPRRRFFAIWSMSKEPFFTRNGDGFVPTLEARGPWDPKSLHGRVVAGLLGQEIERRHGGPAHMPARRTGGMYRPPHPSPAAVATAAVRRGRRVR